MHELAPGVYVETGFRRVTVGAILTDVGFVLIDTPPYPEDARNWQAQLADIANLPVVAIVNTDGHRDRVLGNCWFDSGVIVAHDSTIAYLKSLPNNFIDSAVDTLIYHPYERNLFTHLQLRLPTVGFTQRMQLRFGGRNIPLLAKAGPTSGSVWVHLPDEHIVFTGDSVIVNEHPHISGPCTKDWLENLTVLRRARFQADHIVPGRGPVTDKNATEPISNYLRLARRRVYSLYRAGRPRADTSMLVAELVELFPCADSALDDIQRRVKSGLDRIYEEFKNSEKEEDL